jgi:ubiquinone biosynthesis protein COQ4
MDVAATSRISKQVIPFEADDAAYRPAIPLDPNPAGEPLVVFPDLSKHRDLPFAHRERQPMYFDLPAAWRYFQKFREDKEQTRYVFNIFDSLPWADVDQYARRFLATPKGQAIFASEPFLPAFLDDHDTLRKMGRDTLAWAYCDFTEAHGMSARGLVAEYEEHREGRKRIDDRIEWYVDRLRDTHDLLHVLTGFSSDTLGEECVLTFVCTQRHSLGHAFLGFGGAAVMRKEVKSSAPVLRAVWEAWRMGRVARPIHEESVRELLAMPLDAARRHLNIATPRWYPEAQRIWREEEGVDPHMVLAKAG